MAGVVLIRPAPGDPALAQVIKLGAKARRTVGFLPDSAFTERAEQGTLLVALDGDPSPATRCSTCRAMRSGSCSSSSPKSRQGQGIARALLDMIARDHNERRGILLTVATTSPPTVCGTELDFLALSERPGNSFDRKPLTRWFRPFGQPDLFTYLQETTAGPWPRWTRVCSSTSWRPPQTGRAAAAGRLARRACALRGNRPFRRRSRVKTPTSAVVRAEAEPLRLPPHPASGVEAILRPDPRRASGRTGEAPCRPHACCAVDR